MKNIIEHPLFQVFSFMILMINGKEWGALPYGWYIAFASGDGQAFGILGCIAVLTALTSVFWLRNYLQPLSLLLMWCSLGAFLWQVADYHRPSLFRGAPALVTALLFLTMTVMVFSKRLSWKNF